MLIRGGMLDGHPLRVFADLSRGPAYSCQHLKQGLAGMRHFFLALEYLDLSEGEEDADGSPKPMQSA